MSIELEVGQTLRGTIESQAFGGKGVMRHDGFVIFVPFTCNGEEVEIVLTKIKKSYAEGKLKKVLNRSEDRQKPKCPYFGRCGGCQLQHMSDSIQLDIKKEFIKESLSRIGKVEVPEIEACSAKEMWNYRRKIKLSLTPGIKGHYLLGYLGLDNETLIEVKECPIFSKSSKSLLGGVRNEILPSLGAVKGNKGSLTFVKVEMKFILMFSFEKSLPKNFEDLMQKFFQKNDEIVGILGNSPGKSVHFGNTSLQYKVLGEKYKFSPQGFVQAHPSVSNNIYRSVLSIAKEYNVSTALDTYAGVGVLTSALNSKGIECYGIESEENAVSMALENFKDRSLSPKLFISGKVEKKLGPLFRKNTFDLMILNPPRVGVSSEVLTNILRYRPKYILYISCLPSTLARDVKQLVKNELYTIELVQSHDMFPQTTHVETLLLFKLR